MGVQVRGLYGGKGLPVISIKLDDKFNAWVTSPKEHVWRDKAAWSETQGTPTC